MLRFVNWCASQPIFDEPQVWELNLAGQKTFIASLSAQCPFQGGKVHSQGSGDQPMSALLGAYGEALERILAFGLMNQGKVLARGRLSIWNGKAECVLGEQTSLPSGFRRSSNGWALGSSPAMAIQNAAREALERHILLLSFLSGGWAAFCESFITEWQGHQVSQILATTGVCGFRAGLVRVKVKELRGQTFGYLSATQKEFGSSKRWKHAFCEAATQALAVRSILESDVNLLNPIMRAQRYWLETPVDNLSPIVDPENCKLQHGHVESSMFLTDVGAALKLPGPMYLASVFGGNLIPLVFPDACTSSELNGLQSILDYWGVSGGWPRYHPVL